MYRRPALSENNIAKPFCKDRSNRETAAPRLDARGRNWLSAPHLHNACGAETATTLAE
jgi:hypothetical protein